MAGCPQTVHKPHPRHRPEAVCLSRLSRLVANVVQDVRFRRCKSSEALLLSNDDAAPARVDSARKVRARFVRQNEEPHEKGSRLDQ